MGVYIPKNVSDYTPGFNYTEYINAVVSYNVVKDD